MWPLAKAGLEKSQIGMVALREVKMIEADCL